jgi:cell shape-determining protein MreC
MKKTYLPRHNIFFSGKNFSCGGIALLFAFLIVIVRFFAPNIFWKVFTPVFRISDAFESESHYFISGFGNAAALSADNEQLIQENAALENQNQTLTQKSADISTLSSVSAPKEKGSGILAGVIARPPESPYDTLVLSAGENAGITIGMEVFGTGDVPLGIISSVSPDFSRATLFSAPNTATVGWVGLPAQTGSKNLPIIIFGAGAGAMSATMPRSADVAVGDIVFVPGPGALAIGKVASIESDASSPSVTLHIVSSINLFSTTWVIARNTGISMPMSATSTLL